MISLGAAAVTLGILTLWLPVPTGVPLLLSGLLILVRYSLSARRTLAGASRRYPLVRKILRRTRSLRRPGRKPVSTGRQNR